MSDGGGDPATAAGPVAPTRSSAAMQRLVEGPGDGTSAPPEMLADLAAGGNAAFARFVQRSAGTDPVATTDEDLGPEATVLLAAIDAALYAAVYEAAADPAPAADPDPAAAPQTRGEGAYARARAYLNEAANLKTHVDVLKVAIRDIRAGRSVAYNRNEGLKRLDRIGTVLALDPARVAALKSTWERLAQGPGTAAEQGAFFSAMRDRLATLRETFKGAETHDRIRYLSAAIAELVYAVSDADVSPDEVFTFAYNEGLADHVINELGLSDDVVPTETQLAGVSTTKPVRGFNFLGLDDFMTDLTARREPLRNLLPPGFDLSRLVPTQDPNEHGRIVHSAIFPDLKTALQGMVAEVKRRRRLFLADAAAQGYAAPNTDELVYWTYVYYNPGDANGRRSLARHRGKRVLSDWIDNGEYPNAQKVLQSYRMLRTMKLF